MPTVFDSDGLDTIQPQPEQGSFSRGLERGWEGLKGAAHGFVGLTARAGTDLEAEQYGKAQENFARAQQLTAPTDEWAGVHGVGDAASYVAGKVGEFGPQIAATLVPGVGAGALTGRALLGSGVGRMLVERGIEKGLSAEVAQQVAAATLKKAGADAAMLGLGAAQGAGTLWPSLAEQGDEDAVGKSLGYGAASGAIGMLPGLRAANKLVGGSLGAAENSYVGRLARESLQQGALGGASGIAQNMLNAKALGLDVGDSANFDAFAAGAIGGAMLAPVTALHRNIIQPGKEPQNILGGANEQPRPAPNVIDKTMPTQDWINQTVGIREAPTADQTKARQAQFEAAFAEPATFRENGSGDPYTVRSVDPRTGVENGTLTIGDMFDREMAAHLWQRENALTVPAGNDFQRRILGQQGTDPTGPIHLLGQEAPAPARGVVSSEPGASFSQVGADAYRRQQAGELLSPFETVAARQYAQAAAPQLEIPRAPNLKPEPAGPTPLVDRGTPERTQSQALTAPAESEFAQRFLGQREEPAGQGLILPEKPAVQEPQRIIGSPTLEDQAMAAVTKAERGELLTPVERDQVNQMRKRLDEAVAPQIEVPPARRERETPAQAELPGVEPSIARREPQSIERLTDEQEARGKQPGQYEMFEKTGEPTYAANREVEPDFARLAEATAREAKMNLTDRRRPLLEAIERAKYEGRLSDDEAVALVNALSQSKYAAAEKGLKEATAEGAKAAAEQKHGVTAEKKAAVEEAAAQRKEAADTWNESYHTDGEPTFEKLPKEVQDEWTKAVADGKATTDLYDSLVRKADDSEWKNRRSLARKDEEPKAARGQDLAHRLDDNTLQSLDNGTKLVDHLATQAKSPLVRELAQRVSRIPGLENVRVFADSPELRARLNDKTKEVLDRAQAVYLPQANAIISREHSEVVLMHELMHAATVKRLGSDKAANAAFTRLMDSAKRAIEQKYGKETLKQLEGGVFENLDEFVAYGFTDPKFRALLSDVRLPGEKPTAPSVWQRFVGMVRRVLGIPDRQAAAFDKVMEGTPLLQAMDTELDSLLTSNAGKLDAEGRVLAAKEWGIDPKEATEAAKKAPREFAEALSVNNLGRLRRGKLAMMFSRDIAENYGDMIKGPQGENLVKQYTDHAFKMATTANELLRKAGDTVNKWGNTKDVDALNELAWKSTVMGIHPDEPLSLNGANKHLATDGKVPADVRANYTALREAWNKLSPEAKTAYKETRQLLSDNWNRRETALNKQVMDTYNPLIEQAKKDGNESKMRKLIRERDELIRDFGIRLSRVQGPYFPLMRFGDYFVNFKSKEYTAREQAYNDAAEALRSFMNKLDVPTGTDKRIAESLNRVNPDEPVRVKMSAEERQQMNELREKVRTTEDALDKLRSNGEHYSSESFETEAQAARRAAELNVPVRRASEHFRELNPLSRGFLDKLSESLEAALPPSQVQAARESLAKLYLQTLPDTNAMKNQMKRENVAGFSKNMLRNVAAYTRREAHYLSRLEHMDDMTSTLMQMERGAKEGDSPLKATELYNEMAKRHVASMNYTETPIQDAIARLSFAYQLGVSPAFLLTNMSQPWMLSAPMMVGRHGMGAVGELGRAFGEVSRNLSTAIKENGIHTELDLSKFKPAERKMMETLQKQGLMDVTMEADLGAYERGGDPTSKTSRFSRALAVAPHQVEVVNRAMTALAAYRMEIAKGATPEAATHYAEQVLAKTHFDYSNINAPRPFRPGVLPFGKLITQYRKYQVGVISLLANQFKQATKGATAAEKAEARRALIGTVAMHLLVSGAMGIPGATTVMGGMNLAHKLFGDDDKPFDAESEFRNFLANSMGVEAGAAFSKGLPMLAGLDLSRKVGLGDVLQPVSMGGGTPKTYSDLGKEMLVAGLGPAVGQGINMLQGLDFMGSGQYSKAFEKFLPKSMADLLKSARYGREGITTNKGDVSIDPSRVDPWDQAIAAIGFTPSLVSERGAAVAAVNAAKTEINNRRDELMRDWVKAYTEKDSGAVAEARKKIDKFNEARRENGEQIIKPADLLNSYKARQRGSKSMTEQGVMLAKKDQPLGKRAYFAYVQ